MITDKIMGTQIALCSIDFWMFSFLKGIFFMKIIISKYKLLSQIIFVLTITALFGCIDYLSSRGFQLSAKPLKGINALDQAALNAHGRMESAKEINMCLPLHVDKISIRTYTFFTVAKKPSNMKKDLARFQKTFQCRKI